MKWVTAQSGRLDWQTEPQSSAHGLWTGLRAWDELLPVGGLQRGAVHELLSPPDAGLASFPALLIARTAMLAPPTDAVDPTPFWELDPHSAAGPVVVWVDSDRTLYPPAVFARGIPPARLYLLRPAADRLVWAVSEALRCPGVAAVVAPAERLTRVQARRIQLSAEEGGSVGILLRPDDRRASIYAASSRWRISPCPAGPPVQRWGIDLVHGQGGLSGRGFDLEWDRETNHVRAVDRLSDRSAAATTQRATA